MGAAMSNVLPILKVSGGITIDLAGAFSIVSVVVVTIWWAGTTIADLRSANQTANLSIAEMKAEAKISGEKLERLEKRVSDLERSATRTDTLLAAAAASLGEVKSDIKENTKVLWRSHAYKNLYSTD
jgi:hypothetical protein